MDRLHIIDGYGYIFRAFYALMTGAGKGAQLSNSEGMPTGALYVYTRMLLRLAKDITQKAEMDGVPTRVVVVFDAPGKGFRHELFAEYKANRSETPQELVQQLPFFQPLTESFGWPCIAIAGVEADDVIATIARLARQKDWMVTVFSGDKDLLQLVTDQVVVTDSMKQKTFGHKDVQERYGIMPSQLGDWLALVGDTSDNVPGMPGVGKVTATKLLNKFGSITELLSRTEELKGKQKEKFNDPENQAQLLLSKQLVTLKQDVALGCDIDSFVASGSKGEALGKWLTKFQFSALRKELATLHGEQEPVAASPEEETVTTQVIASPKQLRSWLQKTTSSFLGFYLLQSGNVVRGMSLSDGKEQVYIANEEDTSLLRLDLGTSHGISKDFATCLGLVRTVQLAFFDHKQAARALGYDRALYPPCMFDSMLASHVIRQDTKNHDLESAYRKWIGKDVGTSVLPKSMAFQGNAAPPRQKKSRSAKGAKVSQVSQVHREAQGAGVPGVAEFAGDRSRAVYSLCASLHPRLHGMGLLPLLQDIEFPIANILIGMEREGIGLDTHCLTKIDRKVTNEIVSIEAAVAELAGGGINLGSPKQLSHLLFDTLGLTSPRMKKRKTGYSTDAEVLESMLDMHEVVPLVLRYRELTKLKNTYLDALPLSLNTTTRRIHTRFQQAVAMTGRLSSQEPNLQNIPIRTDLGKSIRSAFVATSGCTLISLDYSQIELRVLAHFCEDPVLMKAFADGVDIHSQTAAEILGVALDKVTSADRRVAKAVNYGLVYGQTDFGLARALSIPRAQAKEYIENYFARFDRVRSYMERVVHEAKIRGYAQTLLGRRRPIADLDTKQFQRRTAAERMAQNTPIQGSAADIMKLAMIAVDKELENDASGARMLLTVHDELVIECPKDSASEVALLCKQAMEGAYSLQVPLIVDVGMGKTWRDAH